MTESDDNDPDDDAPGLDEGDDGECHCAARSADECACGRYRDWRDEEIERLRAALGEACNIIDTEVGNDEFVERMRTLANPSR